MADCLICKRIEMIKNNENPYFVKELETGYVVKVPMFIEQGEKIIVNTNDGKYSSRA